LTAQFPTRRRILGLTAAAVAAAACIFEWKMGPESLVRTILAHRFPGVRIDPASVAVLTRDLMAARFQGFGRRVALESGARAAAIVGLDALSKWGPTAGTFAQLERKIVTFFVLGSNFLDVKNYDTELVTYVQAPGVCPNRFAEYD
jgi:hypothetical protein